MQDIPWCPRGYQVPFCDSAPFKRFGDHAPRMVEYFTQAYFDELANLLNADAEFQSKASNLKANLLFVAKDEQRAFLFSVDNGKVTVTGATEETSADFVFVSDYVTWVANHKDGHTLEKLIMTGKVKFKGSIPRIMMLKSQLGAVDQKGRTIEATY